MFWCGTKCAHADPQVDKVKDFPDIHFLEATMKVGFASDSISERRKQALQRWMSQMCNLLKFLNVTNVQELQVYCTDADTNSSLV